MGFRTLLSGLALLASASAYASGLVYGPQPEPAPSPAPAPRLDARAIFQNAGSAIFTIKTAVNAAAPKSAYGTGFVVSREKGLLATNYHVIERAVTEPELYKLFVVTKDKSLEARIAYFDVLHDVALVSVKEPLPDALPINGDAARLSRGEKLFSVGMPEDLDMSVVEGNFNGTLKQSFYEHFLLSSPINPGMSGGPTFNDQGQVVGVNVAIIRGAQNLSFLVPASHLVDLMNRYALIESAQSAIVRAPASATPASARKRWESVIQTQLDTAQRGLTEEWLNESARTKLAFKGWKVLAPPAGLKCWRVKEKEKSGSRLETETQRCASIFSLHPDHEISAGTYELGYVNLVARKEAGPGFFSSLNEAYERIPATVDMGGMVTSLVSNKLPRTTPTCDSRTIVNRNGVTLRVGFCLSGYTRYGKLMDGVVKLVTIGKSKAALLVTLRMNGFNSENFLKVVESLVQSVAPAAGEG